MSIGAVGIHGKPWAQRTVSSEAWRGALDRVAQIADRKYCRPHARPFRLGFPRKVPVFPICPPPALVRGGSCRATAQPAANRGEAGPACRSGWARLGAAEQRPPVSRTNHGVRAGNSAETADADRLDLLEMGRTLAANASASSLRAAIGRRRASSRRRPRASCRAPPLSLVHWLISRHSECER